jgi:catechol 2,3-dioxygenase-like lactoylglutathione lyase family enzyme
MLKPKALDHVGIIVTDMDRSLRFYIDGLGLELLRRRGAGRDGFAALKIGHFEFNVFCNPALASEGMPQRVDHLCLAMDYATIDDLIAALHAAEIDIASGPVKRSDGNALFVRDRTVCASSSWSKTERPCRRVAGAAAASHL